MSEAARDLEAANKSFTIAHRKVMIAEEKLAAARSERDAKGKLVVEQERLIESIHNESVEVTATKPQGHQSSQTGRRFCKK